MEREIKRVLQETSSTSSNPRGEKRLKRPRVVSSSANPRDCRDGLHVVSSQPPKPVATEEEVEEFFAIVRRMHAASRMMSSGRVWGGGSSRNNNRPRSPREEGKGIGAGFGAAAEWRPRFRWEDFGGEGAEGGGSGKSPPAKAEASSVGGEEKMDRGLLLVAAGGGGGGGEFRLDLNAEPESEGMPG